MNSAPRAIGRLKERAVTDRAALDAILDSSSLAVVCTVDADGLPQVIPTLHARVGDRLILHGSSGAGTLRLAAGGAPIAVCVARMDGLVVAETLFDSSANYGSAVVTGVARVLTGD
ncbi:MAG: pyridoxamine 5'-phosphate oxidase family protein, partial [Propionibacteriales bacterium]|nr:pyridoxamine 5'-phosphate oxidase family protein [Propionibacteriales bacterium]